MKTKIKDLKPGQKVYIKLDYMSHPVEGVIKRIRVEVNTKECGETLVSPKRIVEVK